MTLTEFLHARLGEDEARADAMSHFTVHEQPYYSCAASRIEPLGDLEWGPDAPCDCFLAKRKARALREVAAKRAILAAHEPEPWGEPHPELLRNLATVYSDHPDCQPEWVVAE